jgi:hypothetical protein
VLSVVGGLAALVLVALVASPMLVRRRERRRGEALIAPNPERAAAQGVPLADSVALDADAGRGRLIPLNGGAGDAAIDFGAIPVTFGSGRHANVRLEPSPGVAANHALLWMKNGRIMLRHVGGSRKATLVADRPIEWVTLDDGDEFAIGPHRYRAERVPS